MRFAYITLIAAAAVFYVLYKGELSFVLLVFVIALPAVLFTALEISAAFLKITVYGDSSSSEKPSNENSPSEKTVTEDSVTEREKPAAIKITVQNRSFLPVSSCTVQICYTVRAPFGSAAPAVHSSSMPLGGGSAETLSVSFCPEHFGTVEYTVKRICLSDLMGITHIKRKIGLRGKITVLPKVIPAEAAVETGSVYSAESDSFSKDKPGDDPSEIFMLREYRDGDRHNLIHWKLSGRSENFIVKELSRPISSRILILIDFGSCRSADGADRVMEAAASVSAFLVKNNTVHCIAVPYGDYSVRTSEITDENSLYAELAELSRTAEKLLHESSAAYAVQITDSLLIINGGFSRVIAVSEQCGGAYAEELSAVCGEARLTVICTAPGAEEAEDTENNAVSLA